LSLIDRLMLGVMVAVSLVGIALIVNVLIKTYMKHKPD